MANVVGMQLALADKHLDHPQDLTLLAASFKPIFGENVHSAQPELLEADEDSESNTRCHTP